MENTTQTEAVTIDTAESVVMIDVTMHPPERPGLHCATCHGLNPGSRPGAMIEHARQHRRFRQQGGRYVGRHRDHTMRGLHTSLDRDERYRQSLRRTA